MTAAEQVQRGDCHDWLDEDVERLAGFDAPALRFFIAYLELQNREVILPHHLFGFLADTVLDESPFTDGTDDRAISAQDQLRFLLHRLGNSTRNHRGDGAFFALGADARDLFEDGAGAV